MSVDWRETAACRGRTDVMFDQEVRSQEPKRAALVAARTVCASCPHTGLDGPCVEAWRALGAECDRRAGMWGGFTAVELLAGRTKVEPNVAPLRGLPARIADVLARESASIPQLAELLSVGKSSVSNAMVSLRARGVVVSPDSAVGGAGNARVWSLADPSRCRVCGEWSIGVHCRS